MREALLIRVDAGAQIGTGHVMRSLALAQAWQDAGGCATFVMAAGALALKARLKSEGMKVVQVSVKPGSIDDAKETAVLARQMKVSWVVVDGYHFAASYQREFKDAGFHLLVIDDHGHAGHYYADIVLDQNFRNHTGIYDNVEPYTRVLLGTKYALLRREFLKWQVWSREIPQIASKVLVTLGGGDPHNVTLKVIQALQQLEIPDLEARILIGALNPHMETLCRAVHHSHCSLQLLSGITDMPGQMTWADAGISSGGATCWELLFMGLPSLILILADNQRPIAEQLGTVGVAVNLGLYESCSPAEVAHSLTELALARDMRAAMARRSRELVDAEGAARVVRELLSNREP